MLPLIQRGKAAYLRARGILVLARVDDAWYEKLSSTFRCPAKVPWLSAAKPFTWGCLSRIGSIFCSILCYFVLFCGYFLSDTKLDLKPSRLQRHLGILVRFEHHLHLVRGPGRQAPETSRCHPSLDDWSGVELTSRGRVSRRTGGLPSQAFTPTHQL